MSFVPLMPVGYQDEVAVHEGVTLDAEPFRQELFILRFVMDEDHIGVAAAPRVERRASSLSNDPHVDSGLGLEQWQDMIEQPRVLRRCGRGDNDRFFLREG